MCFSAPSQAFIAKLKVEMTLSIISISNAVKPITFSEQNYRGQVDVLEKGWPIGRISKGERNHRTLNGYNWSIAMDNGDPVLVCPSLREAKTVVLQRYAGTRPARAGRVLETVEY